MARFLHYRCLSIVLICLVGQSILSTQADSKGDVLILNPWTMPLPPVSKNAAVYLSIRNFGEADRLLAAKSPAADSIQFHAHLHKNGLMKMEQQDGIDIPRGESVFKPGHLHIMLFGLTETLVEGHEFPMTLEFKNIGELQVMVKIQQPDAHSGINHNKTKHSE